MATTSTLTDADLARVLGVVERAEPADDREELYSAVLVALREVVPCDDITFQVADVRRRRATGVCVTDAGVETGSLESDAAEAHEFWEAYWAEGGCSYPHDSGDYVTILRRSDRFGDAEFANTRMGSLMARWGVRHEVLVPLAPQGVLDRRLLLFRLDGEDFTDHELLILRLLRPHLSELHLRRQRELSGQPELTPRQWEILRRVSAGASNAQIARVLGLSEATVRKHLENVFVRLHVVSRTEAVERVRPFLHTA
ncbi:MAG: helix-turn-helix transcriptional regulator [Angustibacter sp.]